MITNCQCSNILTPNDRYNPIYKKNSEILYVYIAANDFGPDQIGNIKEAIFQWEYKTYHTVEFDVSYNFDVKNVSLIENKKHSLIIKNCLVLDKDVQEIDTKIQLEHNDFSLQANAFYDPLTDSDIPTICMINERLETSEEFRTSMIHELGHALKLDHNESTNSIMYYRAGQSVKFITEEDVKNFCQKHYCQDF